VRVVFDTNVYVSAFVIPGSLSDDAYRRARFGDFDLFTSVAILTELASKLREKFEWNEDRILAALKSISRTARVVKTSPHLTIVSDAADNRILECAEKTDADLIVTGDPHLLRLARFDRAGIVRVSAFLRILGPAPPEDVR
jgi:putative PIN family toxin of toxin-antitoxin system